MFWKLEIMEKWNTCINKFPFIRHHYFAFQLALHYQSVIAICGDDEEKLGFYEKTIYALDLSSLSEEFEKKKE